MTAPATPATQRPATPKDQWFDGFRQPASLRATAVTAAITRALEARECTQGLRVRRRRTLDQATFEKTVAAVITNVFYPHLIGAGGSVAVTRSKKVLGHASRYRAAALGKTLPAVLDALSAPETRYIKQELGWREVLPVASDTEGEFTPGKFTISGKTTTIAATPKLLAMVAEAGLEIDDFGRDVEEEVIILKAPKRYREDPGDRQEYDDTPETVRWREELRRINGWLEAADIGHDELGDAQIDPMRRRLYRVFNNGSFSQGGRLFGGFWQRLGRETRRQDITIDGENVVELDYGQTALRLLYAELGQTPPDGDLYSLPGWEDHREGMKEVIAASLGASSPLSRMPKDAVDKFPPDTRFREVIEAVKDHHPAIAEHLFTGAIMRLMRTESDILIAVLIELMDQGVAAALPIHDSLLVPTSATAAARDAMTEAYRQKVGQEPVINLKEA